MLIFENPIAAEDREPLRDFFESYEYECSASSFSSLYMWRDINKFSWEIIGDYLCIEGLSHLELESGQETHFMMAPMTRTGEYDPASLEETIRLAREKFERAGHPFTIRLVPEHMLDMMRQAAPFMEFREDRPNFDYIYETDRLSKFRGRNLHGKKNHLNYFLKNYQYEIEDIRPEMTDEIMAFIAEFNGRKNIPPEEMRFLLMEEEAMVDLLRNADTLDMLGCVIRIDGKIEAMAFGGWFGKDTIVEHIEKANTNYRGLYQLVLSTFCEKAKERARFINREEDMGLENLREMKLSYHPYKLLHKYIGETVR
ncbi:MAG: DUF2156 domain-containing protein [Firmicutes bacterium]|nr:DUF2156 domain-containing protein [Bacillota bacterium]